MKTLSAAVVCATLLITPATAQNLTPEDVAAGFEEGVALCAVAKVAGVGISQLPEEERARVAVAGAQGRAFASVPEGRPVWDVLSASGIVLISEPSDDQCNVVAYGPRVRPVFERIVRTLSQEGFSEVDTAPDPSSILRALERAEGERRIRVLLDGGEPGMPGRFFRFPMLLAFVSVN